MVKRGFAIDGKKIKELREGLGLTLKEFGESIGIGSPSQIRSWEENQHVPVLSSVQKIKAVYGLDLLSPSYTWELKDSKNSSPAKNSFDLEDFDRSERELEGFIEVEMPLDAKALAGETLDISVESGVEASTRYNIPRDFLEQFDLTGLKNIKIFEVEGDSMDPDLKAGEKAIVDLSSKSLKDGGIYLLRIEGKTYVKNVFQQDDGLLLVSKNPIYPKRLIPKTIEVEVVGRVARKIEFKVHRL